MLPRRIASTRLSYCWGPTLSMEIRTQSVLSSSRTISDCPARTTRRTLATSATGLDKQSRESGLTQSLRPLLQSAIANNGVATMNHLGRRTLIFANMLTPLLAHCKIPPKERPLKAYWPLPNTSSEMGPRSTAQTKVMPTFLTLRNTSTTMSRATSVRLKLT